MIQVFNLHFLYLRLNLVLCQHQFLNCITNCKNLIFFRFYSNIFYLLTLNLYTIRSNGAMSDDNLNQSQIISKTLGVSKLTIMRLI